VACEKISYTASFAYVPYFHFSSWFVPFYDIAGRIFVTSFGALTADDVRRAFFGAAEGSGAGRLCLIRRLASISIFMVAARWCGESITGALVYLRSPASRRTHAGLSRYAFAYVARICGLEPGISKTQCMPAGAPCWHRAHQRRRHTQRQRLCGCLVYPYGDAAALG